MPSLRALICGFLFVLICVGAIGLTLSLLAWCPYAMMQWGIWLMMSGVGFKIAFDKL